METTTAAFSVPMSLTPSACVENRMESARVASTGLDLNCPTATTFRATIARQTNLSVRDFAVFDVVTSEAGNMVQATVAWADAPWICRTDRNNKVFQVMYRGSEGTLSVKRCARSHTLGAAHAD